MTSPLSVLLPALLLAGTASAAEPSWTLDEAEGTRHYWHFPHAPPTTAPDAPLVLRVPADAYGLTPAAAARGESLVAGATRVERRLGRELLDTYSGLRAWDATGKDLPAWMAVACEPDAPCHVQLTVDERDATYPITVDPLVQAGVLTLAGNLRVDSTPWDDERYIARSENYSDDEIILQVVERDEHGVYGVRQEEVISDITYSFFPGVVLGDQYVISVDAMGGDNVRVYSLTAGRLELEQSWYMPEFDGEAARLFPDGDDAFVARHDAFGDDFAYRFERAADGTWNEVPVAQQDLDGLLTNPEPLPGGSVVTLLGPIVRFYGFGDPTVGEDVVVHLDTIRPPCPSGSYVDADDLYLTSQSESRFLLMYACRHGTVARGAAVDVTWDGTRAVMSPVEGLWELAGPGAYLPHADRWVFSSYDVSDRGMVEAEQAADGSWSYEVVPPVPDLDLFYQQLMAHGPYVVAHEDYRFDGDLNNHRYFAFADAPTLEVADLVVDEGAIGLLSDAVTVVAPDAELGVNVLRYEYPAAYGTLVHADGSAIDLGTTFVLEEALYIHDGSETTTDSFDVVVCDELDLCSPVTQIPVTITPVNDPPTPLSDAVTVDEGLGACRT